MDPLAGEMSKTRFDASRQLHHPTARGWLVMSLVPQVALIAASSGWSSVGEFNDLIPDPGVSVHGRPHPGEPSQPLHVAPIRCRDDHRHRTLCFQPRQRHRYIWRAGTRKANALGI